MDATQNPHNIAGVAVFDRAEAALGEAVRHWLTKEKMSPDFTLGVTMYALHALVASASVPFSVMHCPPEKLPEFRELFRQLVLMSIDQYFEMLLVCDTPQEAPAVEG